MSEYSTRHIGYLMRADLDLESAGLDPGASQLERPTTAPGWIGINAIGRFWTEENTSGDKTDRKRPYRMAEVLASCTEIVDSLGLMVGGTGDVTRVALGASSIQDNQSGGDSPDLLRSTMHGSYPGIELDETPGGKRQSWFEQFATSCNHLGVVTGMPDSIASEELDAPTQMDRLIRSLRGSNWAMVVVASPMSPIEVHRQLSQVINEMRAVENAEQPRLRRSPLAESYVELLKRYEKEYLAARATGLWATSVYLLADNLVTFHRLAASVRGCFSGEATQIDPIRVIPASASLATDVAGLMRLNEPAPAGPGQFRHSFRYQSLLNSSRLSTWMHLPRHEMPGYLVKDQARFDVAQLVSSSPADRALSLGSIVDRNRVLDTKYHVGARAFTKHALIIGVTGSGKTNTVFHILENLHRAGTPFLVIEPAKTEYRALLEHPTIGDQIRVFTVGEETVSPLRLNPFEVEPGVSVATHLDLLKATFNASFAMWSPLPQVLERCLHQVYQDAGWDTVSGVNERLDGDEDPRIRARSFPRLSDLHRTVERVARELGYEERITSDIRAALGTRLHSLRIGGKGRMLDVRESIPIADLLSRPTVIELEAIGDDEEKAFLMGLLLTRIYEHHRASGLREGTGLNHVVVVEEAHRLLAETGRSGGEDSANTRGKAVESFVNMLSEVRAYGQGFIVADQIPSKLSADVIKNTNIKIIHRTIAGDDRRLLGESMRMNERLTGMLATLVAGESVIFAEGDDRPIRVNVPYAKLPSELSPREASARIRQRMLAAHRRENRESLFTPVPECAESSSWSAEVVEFGRQQFESPISIEAMAGVALVALTAPDSLSGAARSMRDTAFQHAPARLPRSSGWQSFLAQGATWYTEHMAARMGWSYAHSALIEAKMRTMLSRLADDPTCDVVDEADAFKRAFLDASQGLIDIMVHGLESDDNDLLLPPVVYRYHGELLVRDAYLIELFDRAMADAGQNGHWTDFEAVDYAVTRLGGTWLPAPAKFALARSLGLQWITTRPDLLVQARHIAAARFLAGLAAQGARSNTKEIDHE